MEFKQLKIFKSVADHLSFTKAAQNIFMAQSSVSAQVKTLEQELGIQLFDRIGRNVFLTDAGRKLYEYARRIEEMNREIKTEISGSTYARGTLTIRVPETLAAVYMPDIIHRFLMKNPRVRLNFINCTDRQLKQELNTGRIDLAFLMTDALHFRDVHVKWLREEKLTFAASFDHPLAGRDPVTFSDIADATFLLPKTD